MFISTGYTTIAVVLLIAVITQVSAAINGQVFANSKQENNIRLLRSEICGSNSSLRSISIKSLTDEHSERTVEDALCTGTQQSSNTSEPVLLWIPVANFGEGKAPSSTRYLGKGHGDEDFAEFCSYDVTAKVCTTANGIVDGLILLLADKYPERYELRDLVFKKWTNSTRLGSPLLAYGSLKNREPSYRYIDQDISYLADTRLEYILPPSVTRGVTVSVFRGQTEAYRLLAGETHYSRQFQTLNAIRYLSPYSVVNVSVIGTESRNYREFRGKLVTVYSDEEGYGWAKSVSSIDGATIETKLTEAHIEYAPPAAEGQGAPQLRPPQQPDGNRPSSSPSSKPIQVKPDNIHIHINELDMGQAYPGFRNVAICAAILFFSVLGVALIDIIRRTLINRRAKRLGIGKYSRV
ncbi:uncharacterized protein LOC126575455 [Anopheles aquasalis]|uniref:uncharacterized protein LOC126575455 n=1 Tax=Anopheles aquasalis TaxID=42839 RepID=UPI00215B410C|nr:uncharacterized protein LOC126575455 [Anopheles aquasalis]XP_050092116.1 uncharacterized protein LOC126575455 [Anopheles aquasalis]